MKILVVGPSWVGDMCMAQVLFKMLKKRYPEALIDVLAPAWTQAMIDRMPEVRKAISLPFGHGEFQFRKRIAFGKSLKQEGYDWSIVLPNSWKSAVIPWAADIPRRTGWLGEVRYGLLNDYKKLVKSDYPLMIQRFAALVDFTDSCIPKDELPVPHMIADTENQQKLMKALGLNLDKPVLALCPGAEYGITKIWPAEKVADVATHYLKQGWAVWVLGSPNDQQIAQDIQSRIQEEHDAFHNLVGKTKLADAVDLLAAAEQVVANDSGLMHIASALNRKVVAIYGSTSPRFTPPLGDQTSLVQLKDLYCAPCFKRTCKEGHLRCLNDIQPVEVISTLKELS